MFEPLRPHAVYLLRAAAAAARGPRLFLEHGDHGRHWGVQAVGIADLEVPAEQQRQGLARFLLGEAFRHLHSAGFVGLAEVHVPVENEPALAVFRSLGFEQVDQAVNYEKA